MDEDGVLASAWVLSISHTMNQLFRTRLRDHEKEGFLFHPLSIMGLLWNSEFRLSLPL
jgi:hypothetical protein